MDIFAVNLGMVSCYLVRDTGTILIDSGPPGSAARCIGKIRKLGIDPEQIGLIVFTHGHNDHTGTAQELQRVTGARVAVHAADRAYFDDPESRPLTGVTPVGRSLAFLMNRLPASRVPSPDIDIVLDNEDFDLAPFGVPGRILHTPGHTQGSVSVLLETGDAFIGDLVMSGFPFHFSPGLPVFADDAETVKQSWQLLLDRGATMFYPGHGKPFPAEAIARQLR